jgi:hypothetical protein
MPVDIRGAEAVGIVTIDWDKRSISYEGIGGDDPENQMTPAEVMARLKAPRAPGVETRAMVLWEPCSSASGGRYYQFDWYGLDDIEPMTTGDSED